MNNPYINMAREELESQADAFLNQISKWRSHSRFYSQELAYARHQITLIGMVKGVEK